MEWSQVEWRRCSVRGCVHDRSLSALMDSVVAVRGA